MMRASPVQDCLSSSATWRDIHGMSTVWSTPEDLQGDTLGICDRSFLTRWGVKGAGAAAWLASQGLPVPQRPNQWCTLPNNGLIARLGTTEFLIEDGWAGAIASQLAQQMMNVPPKVYPVLRQDLAIALTGCAVPELLRQTCSVNFQDLDLTEQPVVLTSMIGVSVVVIPGNLDGLPFYRIWCDGTFGVYLWQTLVTIAQDLGGGPIGAARFYDRESGR
ncbi:MAG TPA: hypothetical protein V6D20_21255 [Candidatus Obscuribacterales bacterium]